MADASVLVTNRIHWWTRPHMMRQSLSEPGSASSGTSTSTMYGTPSGLSVVYACVGLPSLTYMTA